METGKTLWELLWDYDPNGLLVTDSNLVVRVVNPALCQMFRTTAEELIGKPASVLLGDTREFEQVWNEDKVLRVEERRFEQYGLTVKEVLFPIKNQKIIACILVDITNEYLRKEEMLRVKRETFDQIQGVVNKQMHVAQEIASLLGETTAETKSSLLKLINTVEQELK